MMIKPDPGLYESSFKRISRRSYSFRPAPQSALDELTILAELLQEEARDIRLKVNPIGAAKIFRGRIGYGMIDGAVSWLAFIARDNTPLTLARIGYYGEWLVLAATRLGLSTCWVAGTFNRQQAEATLKLAPGETLLCVVPLGETPYGKSVKEQTISMLGRSRTRKSLSQLLPEGDPKRLSAWQAEGLALAARAPSAVNLQPWRFAAEKNLMRIRGVESKLNKGIMPVDLGIAMLHFSLGACHAGVEGVWTASKEPWLAEFNPLKEELE